VSGALDAAGPQAGAIAGLFWFFLAVTGVVFVLVVAAWALALLRRRPPPDAADRPLVVDADRERRMGTAVVAATGLTVVGLVVLLVASVLTTRALSSLDATGAVVVEVVGQQWWWSVRYPDAADPTKSFETANELHVPVGRPVLVKLRSADVIHSFWIPQLAGKRDLIPGSLTTLVLRADREGEWAAQCAEFCGVEHAKMGFVVVAESPERFAAWQARQRLTAPEPATDVERRGRDVFESGPCAVCHSIRGAQARGAVAPDLTHVASRRTLGAGAIPNTRGHMAGWILSAQGVKPGNRMPSMSLPPEDLQALLAYLETLR
jgi:cytochrome c oxidase subunit II